MNQSNICAYPVVACTHRATLHIVGHCEYLNCEPLRKFLDFAAGCENYGEIVLEFGECLSVDSTALGLVARAALMLRRTTSRRLVLANMNGGPKNSATQLGLAHIVAIEDRPDARAKEVAVEPVVVAARVDRQAIREAHEALVELNPDNRTIFADVMSFITTAREAKSVGV